MGLLPGGCRWPGTVPALPVLCCFLSDTKTTLPSPSSFRFYLKPAPWKQEKFCSPPFLLFHEKERLLQTQAQHNLIPENKAMAHKGLINFLYWLRCRARGASQPQSHTTKQAQWETPSNETKEIMESKAEDQCAALLKEAELFVLSVWLAMDGSRRVPNQLGLLWELSWKPPAQNQAQTHTTASPASSWNISVIKRCHLHLLGKLRWEIREAKCQSARNNWRSKEQQEETQYQNPDEQLQLLNIKRCNYSATSDNHPDDKYTSAELLQGA